MDIKVGIKALIQERIAERLRECRKSAGSVVRALQDIGVAAAPFGSTIRGDVHTRSDLDVLILDRHGKTRALILDVAEQASSVPVDLLFADDAGPDALARIKEQIRNGHQIH